MEDLIKGSGVKASEKASGKTSFASYSMIVKKGHGECGDSAFVYHDGEKLVAAVFDGVSGEPGAPHASSEAAAAILASLKGTGDAGEKEIKSALMKGHLAIKIGATTASILFLKKDGSFTAASVGDSPIYSVESKGAISLELPLDRIVKENDSILKFFNFRNMVSCILGGQNDLHMHLCTGKMGAKDMFIIASDGLSDNLFVKVDDGYVTDTSGVEDLAHLIKGRVAPGAIIESLMDAIGKRQKKGRVDQAGRVLVPKDDDISIIVVKRN
jgi:serine/threonine protein phosphatase PrpC